MFREMRRKKQLLSQKECEAILTEETSGVLALAGDDDYPYAVPISYVYDGGKIFFTAQSQGTSWTPSAEIPKLLSVSSARILSFRKNIPLTFEA